VRSSEIFLYDNVGRVLYQSPPSKFRAEVKPPQWFVSLVSPKPEAVMKRVGVATLMVRSDSAGSVREAWNSVLPLLWVVGGFFVLLNVAVYWMLGRAFRPMGEVLGAIDRMQQGDLSARLPAFKQPEFASIAHSLNRMAESLGAERELEENRQLTRLIQSHIEDERRSLARELHDELGQYVTAVKTFAVAIVNKTKDNAPEVSSSAQTIVAAANHIYDSMHNIIRQLRPGALDNLGLTETLRDAVNSWQTQNPQMKFMLEFAGDLQQLGETININIYRIVQESVTNAVRHSEAKELQIKLARTAAGNISLTVQDNGVGMDMENVDQTQHFGLLGMRERVQALNGVFSVDSEMGQGVTIKVEIPN
jgi:two-component system sensor histidine kinase UhpB